VTLQHCTLGSNSVTPMVAFDNSTSVLLDRCSVSSNNNMTLSYSGALAEDASVLVQSSNFTNNMAQTKPGSAAAAIGSGRIAVLDSIFTGNNATRGGAVFVDDTAQAVIRGSRFEANNATWGGAIYATEQATVDIMPGEQPESAVDIIICRHRNSLALAATAKRVPQHPAANQSSCVEQQPLGHRSQPYTTPDRVQCSTMLSKRQHPNPCCHLPAGLQRTMFMKNTATGGGDVFAGENAVVRISGALLANGKAAAGGGSIQLETNSTMIVVNTTVQGALALEHGGCARLWHNTTLRISNSELSGCKAARHGGGMRLTETARVVLVNTTIKFNTAGWARNGSATGSGGGLSAQDASRVELQGSTIRSNTATREAGGLGLYKSATLVVLGPMQTHVFNNTAKTVGGGLQLFSDNFSPTQLTDLLLAGYNSAPNSANMAVGSRRITVVDDGGADNVIASDSREAVLVVTLNVSGPHGWPSEDRIGYSLYTEANEHLGYSPGNTEYDDNSKLRKLPVRFKHPPGER
jgi:predicted outer membrane repeat protein